MNLANRVCEILDFPAHLIHMAVSEAVDKNKLRSTWMKVNGQILYIHDFDFGGDEIVTSDKTRIKVETLDVFLPSAGLYSDGVSCLYLRKLPVKQWCKSYNVKSYNTYWIHNDALIEKDISFHNKAKKVPFFVKPTGELFVNKLQIGTVKDGICTVSNMNFYQEVLDWVTKEKLPWTLQ